MSKLTITVNGIQCLVDSGLSILDAVTSLGYVKGIDPISLNIPHFCYEKGLSIPGSCGICVVEIAGEDELVKACSTLVKEGMDIQTESARVIEARKSILQKILTRHDLVCIVCDKNGSCTLQEYCDRYNVTANKENKPATPYTHRQQYLELQDDNPFFFRDYDKCIACGKCVRVCAEVNGAGVYQLVGSGLDAKVIVRGGNCKTSSCEGSSCTQCCTHCGMCVNVCPVGALIDKNQAGTRVRWVTKKVKTTCPYCGVGCQFQFKVDEMENKIVGIERDTSGPNKGHLCVKGQFGWNYVQSPKRLTTPLIKKDGEFVKATWEEALNLVAEKFIDIKKQYGGQAFAALSSAKCTNEENYLFQKFIRTGLGSGNIDHCARLCHSSTVAGLATAFGSGAMTNSINEIPNTDAMLLIGANTTETHPVIGYRIKEAVKNGAKLIVADPRRIEFVDYADVWLQLKPGTNVALLNGLAHVIVRDGLWDQEFVENHCENFEEWKEIISKYTPDYVAEITGVKASLIEKAAHIYGEADKAGIFYAMGITQFTSGVNNVFGTANLAMVTGNIGKESVGVNALRGQNNVQGSCDMGALPNVLPGYQPVNSEEANQRISKVWDSEIPNEVGLTILEIMDAAEEGIVKAMYIMGENPVMADANANHVIAALKHLDFLVVQDIFLTETAQFADVVLPAGAFAEKDGTFTNTERLVQRVRKAITPPGEAKADWEIVQLVANKMGLAWNYESPKEVFDEIGQVVPSYAGISYARIEQKGLHWPCPTSDHPGTPFLHKDGNFIRGKGKFHAFDYANPAELTDEEYPLVLTTTRSLYHFHTGTMSRNAEKIDAYKPEEMAMISPAEAEKYGLKTGDTIEVASRRGIIKTKVQITSKVPVGVMSMTFHFNESPVNQLTISATDPVCKIPELKVCAVKINIID